VNLPPSIALAARAPGFHTLSPRDTQGGESACAQQEKHSRLRRFPAHAIGRLDRAPVDDQVVDADLGGQTGVDASVDQTLIPSASNSMSG
jgi:hypothetical protein